MGLYDDDVVDARRTERPAEVRRLFEALRSCLGLARAPSATLALLGSTLDGIDALLAESPVLRSDEEVASGRATCLAAGREVRAAVARLAVGEDGLAAGWAELARRHADFAERLDLPDDFERCDLRRHRTGFTLWYPRSWTLDVSEADAIVTVRPEDGSRDLLCAILRVLPAAPSLEDVARAGVERLRQELPGASLSDRAFRTLDDVDAYELSFAFRNEQGAIHGFQVYSVLGNVSFTVSFQARSETHERLLPLARTMERSLRLLKPGF